MSVCKERPATLPPLDAIGLEPVEHTHAMTRGGSGHCPSSAVPPSRQASIGLGFTPSALRKPGANNLFSMGNFAMMGAGSKLSSEERYANSNRAASVGGASGMQYTSNRPGTMQRTASLLNKLTMEKFASISDQIIAWANKSKKEKDGCTLIQLIRLVFEKATDEATWSEMYARLCRKMMEQISTNVQDDGIRNPEGKPITGGQLF